MKKGARRKAKGEKPVFVRSWKPLTPEEWVAAFRDWPETDPRWRALWDMLSHHLEIELAGAEGLPADPHQIVQWSGRIQTLLFIRGQLLAVRRAG